VAISAAKAGGQRLPSTIAHATTRAAARALASANVAARAIRRRAGRCLADSAAARAAASCIGMRGSTTRRGYAILATAAATTLGSAADTARRRLLHCRLSKPSMRRTRR
jgi:hypothetical protein